MRRFSAVFLLSFFMTAATLADVIIDGSVVPGTAIDLIDIDPESGDITINSNAENEIDVTVTPVGNNVSVNLSLNPSSVLINSNTTVTWTVSNATSCTASNGVGTWGGALDPNGGSQVVNSGPNATGITFTIACNDGVNADVIQNAVLVVSNEPVVLINSFVATPGTIETGNTVNVTWDVSDATSCTASGNAPNWSGSKNSTSGNENIAINSAGSYTLTLSCSNSGSNDSENEFVTVNDPTNNCTDPTLDGTIRDWSATFAGGAWPNPSFGQQLFGVVPRWGYTALEFNTGTFVGTGGMVTAAVTANSGTRFGSISPCPGDFVDVPNNCLKAWGPGSSLKWSTEANPSSKECALDSNTTYYFNLTFTNGVDPNSETCQIFGFGSTCFTTLRVFFE